MIENRLEGLDRPAFGSLLRRRRLRADLSQEQLAERARISVQAVSALERGVRHAPRPDTLALLVKTLDLAGDDRDEFERVARVSVKRRVRKVDRSIERRANADWDGPTFSDAFFGRERERAELADALQHDTRCITIWGTGGVGKTRLVIETLRDATIATDREIVFVPLAAAIGDRAVAESVAEYLGVRDARSTDIVDEIVAALGERRTFLVLDNCEHVVEGVSVLVEALLARSDTVTIVCTSRERIRVGSELVIALGPLEVADSIRLFGDRATLPARDARSSAAASTTIATICRRLDGLPLAVELAAARVPSLGLAQIERALDERFALLTRGRRTDVKRHQTLRSTIAWSYTLLSPTERIVFERIALLNGRFSLEDAIAISSDGAIERWDVVDAIAGLIEKAMLSTVDADEWLERPYLLLESTRAFAMSLRDDERADRDLDASRRRLGRAILERVGAQNGPNPEDGKVQFEGIDVDTVRGFLHWAIDEGQDPQLGALVTGYMRNYWDLRGLSYEGLRWSESALRLLPVTAADNEPRIQALRCMASNYGYQGRYVLAMDALKQAYELSKIGNDRSLQMWITMNLAKSVAMYDQVSARRLAGEAWALYEARPDESGLPAILIMDGYVAMQEGNLERARDAYLKLVAEHDANGNRHVSTRLRNQSLIDLAEIEYVLGNFALAADIGRRNVANLGEDGTHLTLCSLANLCIYLVCTRSFDELAPHARRGIELARETGNANFFGVIAQACAMMAVDRGERIEAAAEIFGWASRLFPAAQIDRSDRLTRSRLHQLLREALTEETLAAAIKRGELLDEEEIAATALSLLP